MERDRLRSLLDQQAQACMELSERLRYPGNEPLTSEENRLARVVTLPALQEAFELGLTQYLVYGTAVRLMELLGEAVHET